MTPLHTKNPLCINGGWLEKVAFFTQQLLTLLKKHNQSVRFQFFELEDGSKERATLEGRKWMKINSGSLSEATEEWDCVQSKAVIKATLCVIMQGQCMLHTGCSVQEASLRLASDMAALMPKGPVHCNVVGYHVKRI